MANQKKRTAWSVQDVVNGRADIKNDSRPQPSPRFKSGYSGPKKQKSPIDKGLANRDESSTGVIPVSEIDRSTGGHKGYTPIPKGRQERLSRAGNSSMGNTGYIATQGYGLFDYAWIVFCAILGICVLISVVSYSRNAYKVEGYVYPSYIFSFNGVLNSIFDDYAHGGLGSAYANAGAHSEDNDSEEEIDSSALLGETVATTNPPNSTTGATMALDTGGSYGAYGMAGSYEELITQLGAALEANDFGFVGMKLAYKDEESGNLIGYPQSVVEHFTKYMSDNTGKREIFLGEIKDEDTYMVKNGSAYLVLLPKLAFTINMGYDNTTVFVSGFSEQQMDSGQSAVVSPLLPCMYTITVTTDGGSQTSEVECDMGEGNLQINIGVSS